MQRFSFNGPTDSWCSTCHRAFFPSCQHCLNRCEAKNTLIDSVFFYASCVVQVCTENLRKICSNDKECFRTTRPVIRTLHLKRSIQKNKSSESPTPCKLCLPKVQKHQAKKQTELPKNIWVMACPCLPSRRFWVRWLGLGVLLQSNRWPEASEFFQFWRSQLYRAWQDEWALGVVCDVRISMHMVWYYKYAYGFDYPASNIRMAKG